MYLLRTMPNKMHAKAHGKSGERGSRNKRHPKAVMAKAVDAEAVEELFPDDRGEGRDITETCMNTGDLSLVADFLERIPYTDVDRLHEVFLALNRIRDGFCLDFFKEPRLKESK